MKKSMQISILAPIVVTIVILMLSLVSVKGQNDKPGVVKYEKTLQYTFKNTSNEFLLYGVGKVVIKGNSTNIRCEVSITGYGSDLEEAKNHADNIDVEAFTTQRPPKLKVSMKRGNYRKNRCKVVTTVYLPPTVTFQHNEDMNVEEFVYRLLNKIRK